MTEQLNKEPGGVAAGTGPERERFFRRLNTRFHPDEVLDVTPEPLVQLDEESGGASRGEVDGFDEFCEPGTRGESFEKGLEVLGERGVILKGKFFGVFFDKEIEGIDDGQIGGQMDGDFKALGLFRDDQAGEIIAERILLPIEKMLRRGEFERVAGDGRSAVRGRSQANHLRPERDEPVVFIAGDMTERDANGHSSTNQCCWS